MGVKCFLYKIETIADRLLGYIITYTLMPVFMGVIYMFELLKSMMNISFYRKYPFSCAIVIVTLFLSLCQAESSPTYEHIGLDKYLCAFFYFLMTSVFWIEYLRHHKMQFIDYNWAWFPCIVCPIVMSGAIELMQNYLIESRRGEWLDFVFNIVGTLLSAFVWSVWLARRKHMTVITEVQSYEK